MTSFVSPKNIKTIEKILPPSSVLAEWQQQNECGCGSSYLVNKNRLSSQGRKENENNDLYQGCSIYSARVNCPHYFLHADCVG